MESLALLVSCRGGSVVVVDAGAEVVLEGAVEAGVDASVVGDESPPPPPHEAARSASPPISHRHRTRVGGVGGG